ncbi:baseplate J protein [Paenibacillus sp. BIHB 4019]|uniref:Baseplate J protein n=2 Tax=Paenibacillus sp. BIHB 4019 TaxID=1870819 RepID=A0A1B2DSS0_9BACL|nr:baseplate J protein [Paenibacillus sp. BIHB 4019]
MLDASPAEIDKRQGSVTYDLLSPAAIEMALAYIEMDNVLNFGFVDTTYGQYLDLRAAEYGLTRKVSAKSTGTLTFSGAGGVTVPVGTRVQTSAAGEEPVYFTTTASGTLTGRPATVTVPAEADEASASGNVAAGAINTVLGGLSGVVTVTNNAAFTGGAVGETEEEFRARILERAAKPATSGNANQYRQWALEVSGVSDAQVIPVWSGPGTVKVVLLAADKTAPDSGTVTAAASYIESLRPIGATVTVVGATEIPINVSVSVTLAPGATIEAVEAQITEGVTAYLASIAFNDNLVRYTRIAAVILDLPPVVDYEDLTVNGGISNVLISAGQVAVPGTVAVTE